MTVDRPTRDGLRTVLTRYMLGDIRSFDFEDRIDPLIYQPKTTDDDSVRRIAHFLWSTYDSVIDHSVSVTQEGWESYRRIVAFLGTDLEMREPKGTKPWRHDEKEWWRNGWPFNDQDEWVRNEGLLNGIALPHYDPAVHGRPANPWWNRIPTSTGLLIIACGVVLMFIVTGLLLRCGVF